MLALQRSRLYPFRVPRVPPLPASASELRAHLERQTREALIELLVGQAEHDQGLRERLVLAAATTPLSSAPVDVAHLEQAIRRAIEVQGYIDYRGASGYALQVEEALDVIERVLNSDGKGHALRLVEAAIEALEGAMGNVDDSGELRSALEQLKSLHVRACAAAEIAPDELARKLFELELEDSYGLFLDCRDRYAHVLGAAGTTEFERCVRDAWSHLPALGPNQREREGKVRRARLREMVLGLAGDDVEARINVIKKDLSMPSAYLSIAMLCRDSGQLERAKSWVSKGLKAFPRHDPRLVQLAADISALSE